MPCCWQNQLQYDEAVHNLSRLYRIAEIPAADMRERVKRRLASIYASLGDYDALSSVAKPGERQLWLQSSAFQAAVLSCLHDPSDMFAMGHLACWFSVRS